MDVACQHCPSVYPISEQKLAGRLVRFRCKSCGNAIVVDGRQNPSQPPAAITSVPPLSFGNIASSVAPYPVSARVGFPPIGANGQQPPPVPSFPSGAPSAPSNGSASPSGVGTATLGQVPRLAPLTRAGTDKSSAPPPFPSVSAKAPSIIQSQPPSPQVPPPSGSAGSAPNATAMRLGSEPAPAVRAPSQPHNPHPQEVDPSVYEDETVAMTAMELEAAADAQSQIPASEPPPAQHWASSLTNNPASTVLAAPAPIPLKPPPHPWMTQPVGTPAASAGPVGGIPPQSGVQAFGEGAVPAPPNVPSFDYDGLNNAPHPTRAESWNIGKSSAAPNPFTPAEWRPQPSTPAPASGRTLASAESPPQDNPWLFRGLLVVLGIGGVVLGGILGNTWLRHLLPAASQTSANTQSTEIQNPHLPTFDALGANERLEAAQTEAVNCLNADTAPLTGLLVARFRPSGELDALTMTGSVGTAPETPCIRSVFDKVTVPPFKGVTSQVEKALELRPRP